MIKVNDDIIIDYFISKRVNKIIANNISRPENFLPEYKEYLDNRFPKDEFVTYANTIWRIYYNIEECPKCKTCGKKLPRLTRDRSHAHIPQQYCSAKCSSSNKETKEKTKKTCLIKYGYEHSFQTENNKEKSKKTKLEKYGDKNYNNHEQYKQTCLKKYGVDNVWKDKETRKKALLKNIELYGNPNNQEKIKQTCLGKYGVTNVFARKDIIEKISLYNKIHHGVTWTSQSEKTKENIKKSNRKKFGTDYWLCNNDNIRTIEQQTNVEKVRNKSKETCLSKYGNTSWNKSNTGKETLSNIFKSPEVQQKIYETKKKNNAFNVSKPEENLYIALCNKFHENDIIRQYRSKEYPFNCDFYIKSLDTYIELQGNWTHGFHAFGTHPDDEQTLLEWKSKQGTNPYYKQAIYTWTDLDPRKREIAKENNLNYIEIWPLDNINKIINELC